MLCAFSFGCFQIYQNKSAKNIAIYFIGTIVPIKCMPKITAVGLFCLEKIENNQTRTHITFFRMSKLTELYFRIWTFFEGKKFKPNFYKVRIYKFLGLHSIFLMLWSYAWAWFVYYFLFFSGLTLFSSDFGRLKHYTAAK